MALSRTKQRPEEATPPKKSPNRRSLCLHTNNSKETCGWGKFIHRGWVAVEATQPRFFFSNHAQQMQDSRSQQGCHDAVERQSQTGISAVFSTDLHGS